MLRSLARDVLRLTLAGVIVTFVCALVMLGLLGWVLPGRPERAPLFLAAFAWPVWAVGAALAAILYSVFRGAARRGRPIEAHRGDGLGAPVLSGVAAAGVAGLVMALARGATWAPKQAFLAVVFVAMSVTVMMLLAAWLTVLIQRLTPRPLRAAAIAAGLLFVVGAGARIGADVWGERWIARLKPTLVAEIAGERARIAAERRPVLFGAPIEENGAPRYRALTQTIADKVAAGGGQASIFLAVQNGLAQPIAPEAAQWVEQCRAELTTLAEGVRCTRCNWEFPWELGPEAPIPSLLGARHAANLAVIEAHQHAQAGDVEGALERYLNVIRFGNDYQGSGALIGWLIANGIQKTGTEALLRFAAAPELATRAPWQKIGRALDALEPHPSAFQAAWRSERLAICGLDRVRADQLLEMSEVGLPQWTLSFAPVRFVMADTVRSLDARLRETEDAAGLPDAREIERRSAEIQKLALASHNPLLPIMVPSLLRALTTRNEDVARFRLLRTVARLEEQRGAEGPYLCATLLLDLPVDPFGYPAKLRYECLEDGQGYRLWSVGPNHTDDGGRSALTTGDTGTDDVAFERSPRALTAAQTPMPR